MANKLVLIDLVSLVPLVVSIPVMFLGFILSVSDVRLNKKKTLF